MFVPYGAGTAKFTVNFGIAALETFLAQIDAVLGAHVAGLSIRMVHTFSHLYSFQALNIGKTITFLSPKSICKDRPPVYSFNKFVIYSIPFYPCYGLHWIRFKKKILEKMTGDANMKTVLKVYLSINMPAINGKIAVVRLRVPLMPA